MKNSRKLILVAVLAAVCMGAKAQKKAELCPTPMMSWNSWNWFKKDNINEKIVMEIIDVMAENGLRDLGYNTIVVDGGWRDSTLGPNGELRSHPEKFPHGMKYLSDYAHSKGFKFGLHTVPGIYDCGCDKVGGYGHEAVHVQQFVDWGLDFIKLDRCRMTDGQSDGNRGWDEDMIKKSYLLFSQLLYDCGRDITLTICAYKYRDWYPQWCNMARTTGDIGFRNGGGAFFERSDRGRKGYNSIMEIAKANNEAADFAGNGYWNDPDILVVGEHGLTENEQRIHFALWCIMTSPLALGNDPREMKLYEKEIIMNTEAIEIDQDTKEQGRKVYEEGPCEIWLKHLSDGTDALLVFNRSKEEAELTLDLKAVLGHRKAKAHDVWTGEALPTMKKVTTFKLDGRNGRFLRLSYWGSPAHYRV